MNTFGQGFKFGLLNGVLSNTFGSFGMNGFNSYMANPFCNYSFSPMYFTPTFSFGSFMPYNNVSSFSNPFNYMGNLNFGSSSVWDLSTYSQDPTFRQYTNIQQPQYNMDSFIYTNNIPTLELGRTNYEATEPSITVSTPASTPVATVKDDTKPEAEKPSSKRRSEETRTSQTSSETSTTRKKDDEKVDYSVENLKAKWKKKKPNLNLSDEFYNKIIKISKDINCDPNDLMGIINLETSGTFNPSIKNGIGATGLIQFLPDVTKEDIKKGAKKDLVKRVGKRISELEKMSAEEQLDYVEKYFKSHIKEKKIKGRIDGATLYSIVFWPKAANKNNDYVIAKQGSNVYAQNPLLDKDKSDKAITKKDLGERLKDFIA